jgi:hypothetical protein
MYVLVLWRLQETAADFRGGTSPFDDDPDGWPLAMLVGEPHRSDYWVHHVSSRSHALLPSIVEPRTN